jgi:hypothetical protein
MQPVLLKWAMKGEYAKSKAEMEQRRKDPEILRVPPPE